VQTDNLVFFRLEYAGPSRKRHLPEGLTAELFKPSLLHLYAHNGSFLLYMFWYIFSLGNYRIFYVRNREHRVVAYSHLLPRIFKFPFMSRDDLHMGPSWTDPEYRNRGIHTYMKHTLLEKFDQRGRAFWAVVEARNTPSIRVQHKNGFEEVGRGYKSRYLGIYTMKPRGSIE